MAQVESGGGALAPPPPVWAAAPTSVRGWLFHPLVDFFCLGGGSLLLLLPLLLVPQTLEMRADLGFWMLLLTNIVNHPHFAHSYQIFYSGFRGKAFGQTFDPDLRRSYLFAGVAVPVFLLSYLLATLATGSATALGYAGNVMLFLVGWHYVKQGYGIAMLDAALKRRFFTAFEKKVLLWNSYACWLLSWLLANRVMSQRDLWGLAYYSFSMPDWLIGLAMATAASTTVVVLATMLQKGRAGGWRLPWNGLLAYAVSLYVWLILGPTNPLLVLCVPAFHSLQYLVVVWRYQLNRTQAAPDAAIRPGRLLPSVGGLRLTLFLILGILLGWLGFWGLPAWLNDAIAYDRGIFGATALLFVFWIFINIHHYFLDNVMWRRENPEARRFLFNPR
jgi:hypothetical protein